MNKKLIRGLALCAVAGVAVLGITSYVFAQYQANPYTAGLTAGTEVSATYQGRYITILESELTHPSHTDGLVNKGDPVFATDGDTLVGVAMTSAAAATDYISIDTEGIWNLSVYGHDGSSAAAVDLGDGVYLDATAATLSVDNSDLRFGFALHDVTSGNTTVIPVKVHWDQY